MESKQIEYNWVCWSVTMYKFGIRMRHGPKENLLNLGLDLDKKDHVCFFFTFFNIARFACFDISWRIIHGF